MVVLRYVCIYCTYLRQESHKSGSSADGGSKLTNSHYFPCQAAGKKSRKQP